MYQNIVFIFSGIFYEMEIFFKMVEKVSEFKVKFINKFVFVVFCDVSMQGNIVDG